MLNQFAQPASRYIFGTIPFYSVLMVTGIIVAIIHCLREEKRLGLKKDTIVDLALLTVPAGIIGARLYYVAFAWDVFASDWTKIFRIWEGGLAIYGAVIGGFIAVLLFSIKRKISVFTLTDIIAPGLILAQAIGRWGNYFNMEAYGEVITDPAWQFFPFGVLISTPLGDMWHQATFFYESFWNFLTFLALYRLRLHRKKTGDLTCWYFLLYGAGRFVIEGLRTDSLMSGTLRISQVLSLVMCGVVVIYFALRLMRTRPLMMLLLIPLAVIWALTLMNTSILARILTVAPAILIGAVLYGMIPKNTSTKEAEAAPCQEHP